MPVAHQRHSCQDRDFGTRAPPNWPEGLFFMQHIVVGDWPSRLAFEVMQQLYRVEPTPGTTQTISQSQSLALSLALSGLNEIAGVASRPARLRLAIVATLSNTNRQPTIEWARASCFVLRASRACRRCHSRNLRPKPPCVRPTRLLCDTRLCKWRHHHARGRLAALPHECRRQCTILRRAHAGARYRHHVRWRALCVRRRRRWL